MRLELFLNKGKRSFPGQISAVPGGATINQYGTDPVKSKLAFQVFGKNQGLVFTWLASRLWRLVITCSMILENCSGRLK